MAEIVRNDPDSSYILWHDLEDERRAIQDALPEAVSIYGSQDLDLRERHCRFQRWQIQISERLPVIAGSGCNFQRFCHKAIFVGIGFKFNDLSAVHRIQRFLQAHPVEIHIIHSEAEREVLHADGQVAAA